MKYRISHVPNSQNTLNYKVTSQEGDKQASFAICKELFEVWGKPADSKLGEVMIAYIKKNGWSKAPVVITEEKAARNINTYVHSLGHEKKK